MSRRVPLNSPEGRRLVERGPAWREHPDYYRLEPDNGDIPWHTEADVTLAMARIGNYLEQHAGAFHSRARRCRDLSARFENDAWVWENVARVALGMKPLD